MTLNALEQSVHIQNVITDNFQVACFRMGSEEDPYIALNNAFGDPATTISNITNYHNPQVAEILDTLRTSADEEERKAAVEELGLLFAEDVPNTWTGGNNQFIATRPEVDGVDTWTMPDGTVGNGAQSGITIWGQVWLNE